MQGQSRLTMNDLRPILGPLVYVLRKKKTYLYIGSSGVGILRIFSPANPSAIRCLKHGARLEITLCKTLDEARRTESDLILKFDPILNKVGGPIKRTKMEYIERVRRYF